MADVKYVLTLDEEQARLVSHACDFLSRIHIGQLRELRWEYMEMHIENGTQGKYVEMCNEVDRKIDELNDLAYPSCRYGKYRAVHDSRTADVLYNVHQVLRHKIAHQHNPEGGIGVDFHEPMRLGAAPLPECKVIKNDV